jgi:hypothetical protein
MGWPESKVFWAKRTGASIGLAPYEASTAPINQPRARRSKNLVYSRSRSGWFTCKMFARQLQTSIYDLQRS